MSRLYAIASTPNLTSACADHRFMLAASDIEAATLQIARALGISAQTEHSAVPEAWITAMMNDLRPGNSLVIAGETQPPFVHALIHAMNSRLGNVGTTVTYSEPVIADPAPQRDT